MSEEMMMELKPCPFCGSPASLEHDSDHHGEWFNLGCSRHWEAVGDDEPSCPAGRMWYTAGLDEEAGAIEAWNRRAPDHDTGLVDALKETLEIASRNEAGPYIRRALDALKAAS